MTPYREQWKDPRWQKKRLEALEAADWQCQNCSGHEVALNVHHKLYRKGALVWDYDIDDLQVLCEPCHQSHHENERALKEVMARGDFEVIAGVVAGYCSIDDNVDQGFVEMLAQATMPHDFAVGYTAALLSFLPFRDLRKVAEFAVSLTKPGSEVRMRFEHDHGVYLKDRG